MMVAKRKLQQPGPQPYLRIFVPGKPVSVNRMYVAGRGTNRHSGRRRTDDCVAWEQSVWVEVRKHMALLGLHGGTAMRKPLRIDVEFFRIRANGDVDNYLKCTLDGLKDALRVDDRFYSSVTARRGVVTPTARQGALVTVWEAN